MPQIMDAVREMLSETENEFSSDADKPKQNITQLEEGKEPSLVGNTIDSVEKDGSLSRATTLLDNTESTSSKSNPPQARPLTEMPMDLIAEITKNLPLSSVVALSLTNKDMLSVIGTEVWEELRERKNQTQLWDFLALLDRDFPNHRICHLCDTLHKRSRLNAASHYLYVSMRSRNNCMVTSGETFLGPSISFTFEEVQLVMRSYRFSNPEYGFPLGSLARSYRAGTEYDPLTEHVVVRPRISVDGELLIERKHIMSIKTTGKLQHDYEYGRITVSLPFDLELLDLSPCKHREPFFLTQESAVLSAIICLMYHRSSLQDGPECRVCQPVQHQCRACQTYWEVDPLRTWQGRERSMVTITTWRNLGECMSLFDWAWRRHLMSSHWPQDAPQYPPVNEPNAKDRWEEAGDNGIQEMRRYI